MKKNKALVERRNALHGQLQQVVQQEQALAVQVSELRDLRERLRGALALADELLVPPAKDS